MPAGTPKPRKPYRRAPSGSRGDRTGHKGPRQKREPKEVIDPIPRDLSVAPPVIAVVGRPNVGKSTMLNAFTRSLVSIVDPTPGVTRDRVGVLCTLADRTVEFMDTGGVGIVDAQGLESHVEAQVETAIRHASVILFVVDARDGVMPYDRAVADRLRRAHAPVLLLANKAEAQKSAWNLAEFSTLGYGEPIAVSAQEGLNLQRVEEEIRRLLPEGPTTPVKLAPPLMHLAFAGRVNVGKSSLVNALLHEERMIVSEVPGTTRDSVDLRFTKDGKSFVLIDTAGIRKEKAVQNSLEFYAKRRSERAMRRADVTALILDATMDVSRIDRTIAGYATDAHHPVVVVVNKWDLAPPDFPKSEFVKYIVKTLDGLTYAPVVFTSALKGRNVTKIVQVAYGLHVQAQTRVTTGQVNKAIVAAYAKQRPRPMKGGIGKIFYGTQVDIAPPTFILFVDDPGRFDETYTRYLENRFREMLPFPQVPMRINYKSRMRSPSKNTLGPKPKVWPTSE